MRARVRERARGEKESEEGGDIVSEESKRNGEGGGEQDR